MVFTGGAGDSAGDGARGAGPAHHHAGAGATGQGAGHENRSERGRAHHRGGADGRRPAQVQAHAQQTKQKKKCEAQAHMYRCV